MTNTDVLVVGGGVIGCAVAYHTALKGLSVTLLERGQLACEASGAAAGILAPGIEGETGGPYVDWSLRSLEMFPDICGELLDLSGIDPQFCTAGMLRVAADAEEAAQLRNRQKSLPELSLEWLRIEKARELEPSLAPGLVGALFARNGAHVHPGLLTKAYAAAAARRGVKIKTGIAVTDFLVEGDRVIGVGTTAADYHAGQIVLCAGAFTRWCSERLGTALPLEPVRGQILSLEAMEPVISTIIWGSRAYLVPRIDGTLVVGATVEHVGLDCRVTPAGLLALLGGVTEFLPKLADATFISAWAGLRPATPDGLPFIGPLPGVEGVVVASGHFRNGILLAPITGVLIADGVEGNGWGESTFLPGRALPIS